EGDEHEKLLSFFPTIAPVHVRTSIVGLAQAVASFADTLTQDDCRFKSMVAEHNKWVMFECEPSIWLLVIARKSWAGASCTDAAYKALLTSTYDVFVLLHGRMSMLLEQDPTGFAVRRVLQPLLDEVSSRLLRPEAAAAREAGGHWSLLANPLGPHSAGVVPLLTTSHAAFLAVQCLVQQLLVASFYGTRLVGGVMVLWGGMPLASTLGPEDTAALTTLAARALAPAARAAQRPRPGVAATALALAGAGPASGAAAGEPAFDTLLSPLQWRAGGGIHPPAPSPPPPPSPPPLPPSAATGLSGGGASSNSGLSSGGVVPAAPSLASGAVSTVAGFLSGFGAGASLLAAAAGLSVSTPTLPVSSSAAAGPSSSSPSPPASTPSSSTAGAAAAAAAGGGVGGVSGVGSALPPFLSSFLRPRLRPSMYSSGSGGGGSAGVLPLEGPLPLTSVWLRGSNEWAQLLPYHRGPLLVLALLHDGPPPAPEVLAALAAVMGRGAGPAAAALAAEVPARSVWHEKGHRYCFTDATCHAARFTPPKKVLTLSAGVLRHMGHLRNKMDEWEGAQRQRQQQQRLLRQQQGQQQLEQQGAAAAAGAAGTSTGDEAPSGSNAPPNPNSTTAMPPATSSTQAPPSLGFSSPSSCDDDAELVVRTARDAWLVLRAAPGGRRLYTASEQGQGQDASLMSGVAPTEALCDRLFPGVFLMP
ncbi:hypothetical protein Agub_g2209, partial [Astrephomene gubernaculifera]